MPEITAREPDCNWRLCCLWECRDWPADWLLRGCGTAQDSDDWVHRGTTGHHWVVQDGTLEPVIHCPSCTAETGSHGMARVHIVQRWGHCTAHPQSTEVETDWFHWGPWTPQLQPIVDWPLPVLTDHCDVFTGRAWDRNCTVFRTDWCDNELSGTTGHWVGRKAPVWVPLPWLDWSHCGHHFPRGDAWL